MDFNLNIDYKRSEELEKLTNNVDLTVDYFNYVVNNVYPNGMEGQMGRLWGRMQRKLLNASDSQIAILPLGDSEIDFLEKCFEKVKYPSNVAMYFLVLEDTFKNAIKEKDSNKGGEEKDSE